MRVVSAGRDQWMVRVDKGEEVVESLLRFAAEHDVRCASVTGLGGVDEVRIAYLDVELKEYLPREIDGVLELASLVGNLTREGEKPFLHAHVVVSDREFRCYGGHLLRARVAVTGEFAVHVGEAPIQRACNPDLGIKQQHF